MMTSQRLFMTPLLMAALAVICLFYVGCAGEQQPAGEPTEEAATSPAETPAGGAAAEPAGKKDLMNPSSFNEQAPDTFVAKLETSKGDVRIQVTRDWAPLGADRFYNLVKNGFYDECRFFRVRPKFVVQFGLNGDPKVTEAWADSKLVDDPVVRTNRRGSVVFAKPEAPDSRTTQVFFNLTRNAFLDSQGFAPFGMVIEGLDVIESVYSGYNEKPDQGMIAKQGNEYLSKQFPRLDYIKQATIE